MKLINKTDYDTQDLRRFVLAGLKYRGADTKHKTVEIAYTRGHGRGCSGRATVGRGAGPLSEGRWIQLNVPNRAPTKYRHEDFPGAYATDEGLYGPDGNPIRCRNYGSRTEDGKIIFFHEVREEGELYAALDEHVLHDLAHVLSHEVDHNFGLRDHRDIHGGSGRGHNQLREARGDWWKGLPIRRKVKKPVPPREVRVAELISKRESHARRMAENWALQVIVLESQVKAAKKRQRKWAAKVGYYEKKAAAGKGKS